MVTSAPSRKCLDRFTRHRHTKCAGYETDRAENDVFMIAGMQAVIPAAWTDADIVEWGFCRLRFFWLFNGEDGPDPCFQLKPLPQNLSDRSSHGVYSGFAQVSDSYLGRIDASCSSHR